MIILLVRRFGLMPSVWLRGDTYNDLWKTLWCVFGIPCAIIKKSSWFREDLEWSCADLGPRVGVYTNLANHHVSFVDQFMFHHATYSTLLHPLFPFTFPLFAKHCPIILLHHHLFTLLMDAPSLYLSDRDMIV
jgi:hypothetical protein